MEIIEFLAEDGAKLNGYINKGESKTEKILIATHGMSSNCLKQRENIIAKKVETLGIDTICFNNRGNGIVNFVKFQDGRRELAGTAFENIEECYFDILGAIQYAIDLGYKEIYLQGHSLGASKMLYAYNKLKQENSEYLQYVKGILLLSFVDVSAVINKFSTEEILNLAKKKMIENQGMDLMPYNSFLSPISVKNYLKYIQVKEEINEYEQLNNLGIPLFMRWGNVHELIEKPADEHAKNIYNCVENDFKDINYIDGANHSYDGKENELADDIFNFFKNIK
ncbi:MAG: hypothetical protein IJH76_02575 [Clostridia bacterium]|nr:hypothetical protein [Clostridia bacterium]